MQIGELRERTGKVNKSAIKVVLNHDWHAQKHFRQKNFLLWHNKMRHDAICLEWNKIQSFCPMFWWESDRDEDAENIFWVHYQSERPIAWRSFLDVLK